MDRHTWRQMLGLGIFFYTLAQEAQYVSLSSLPAVTLNLVLGFNPVVVTLLGMALLAEVPNWPQWLGVAAAMAGLLTKKWVPIGLVLWLIIAYLAVVNTALAFTLWNLTQRTLPAMESSMINNAMTIQVPVIAVLFLGESLGFKEVVGLALIALGVLAVQTGRVPFLRR